MLLKNNPEPVSPARLAVRRRALCLAMAGLLAASAGTSPAWAAAPENPIAGVRFEPRVLLAGQALLVSMCVPLCNVAAVWPLARQGGHGYLKELARNPLILATLSGLAANLAGLQLPELAAVTLSRIGAAALPLGLMAVGAGLRFGALREAPWLATALMGIRHLALPAVGIALVLWLRLPPAQQAVIVAFSAMPTASSAYVLATRMGGNGGYVAGLVTVSTLLAMVGLPAALGVLALLR